jgi:hypothetical protein
MAMHHQPVVYVPQEPRKRDGDNWRPLYDLSPALKFGVINILLPHGPTLLDVGLMVAGLKEKLKHITEDDHILLIGDPVAIAATVLVAGQLTGGKVKLLKYDRNEKLYNVVSFAV